MNRQRILLIVVGCIGALLLGRAMFTLYTDALSDQKKKIVLLKTSLDQIKREKEKSDAEAKDWAVVGAQTLSMDPDEDMRILRDRLFELIKKSGLEKEKVDLGTVQNWGKNGVKALGCNVTAEGTMDKIIQFMFTIYRRPFVVRFKALTLAPASTGKNAIKGQLKMTAKLETLILPPNAKVPSITPVDLKDGNHLKEVERTQLARVDDYKLILDRKIWEPYVPPMPGKATGPTPLRDALGVDPNTVKLSWVAGSESQKHHVFFGENAPTQDAGMLTTTELPRPGLKPGTRYAWRVDEMGEGGTTPGDVWAFVTSGEQPHPPAPVAVNPQPTVVVPPPPADGKFVLKRVLSSPTRQQAILVDGAQATVPNAPDKRVEVGETLFGGLLIYVHPRGVVSEHDGLLRFHPLGVALEQGQPLTEQSEPEIYYELKKLEASATGISERPG